MALTNVSSCSPALPWKIVAGTMPFLMVEAVRAPTVTAPRNSKMAAAMQAWRRVSDFEETEVANELATSLAYPRKRRVRAEKREGSGGTTKNQAPGRSRRTAISGEDAFGMERGKKGGKGRAKAHRDQSRGPQQKRECFHPSAAAIHLGLSRREGLTPIMNASSVQKMTPMANR